MAQEEKCGVISKFSGMSKFKNCFIMRRCLRCTDSKFGRGCTLEVGANCILNIWEKKSLYSAMLWHKRLVCCLYSYVCLLMQCNLICWQLQPIRLPRRSHCNVQLHQLQNNQRIAVCNSIDVCDELSTFRWLHVDVIMRPL